MSKKDKLSKKEKGFVKDYVKTGNGTQSILNNYDTDNPRTAAAMAVENLTKPNIQNAIKSIADKIPDELLERVHIEGLNAGKKVFKNNVSSGEIEEVEYEPDYAVRHKYLDTAYKIKKLYEEEGQRNINVIVPVLVKFLNAQDESTNNNRDTN